MRSTVVASLVCVLLAGLSVAGEQRSDQHDVLQLPSLEGKATLAASRSTFHSFGKPSAHDALAPVRFDWSGVLALQDAQDAATLRLTYQPLQTFPSGTQLITIIAGIQGELNLQDGRSWQVRQENIGPFMARAHYLPERELIAHWLPLMFTSPNAEHQVFAILYFNCEPADGRTAIECEAPTIGFDGLRAQFRPEANPASYLLGFDEPVRITTTTKDVYPDCCMGGFRCCCHSDCEGGTYNCPGLCSNCKTGGCDDCKRFLGCQSCQGTDCDW